MTKEVWFWIIFVLVALFGLFFTWPGNTFVGPWGSVAWTAVFLILIGLLGWKVFGSPVK